MEWPIRAHDPRANALTNVGGGIPEHRVNTNISRPSCLHPLAKISRHHPLTSSLRKIAARNRAAKGDKKRQRICRNLSLQLVAFCRLLSLGARSSTMMQMVILDRARVTPRQDEIFTARQSLADDCAKSRKSENVTSDRTSCEMLRAMMRLLQRLVLPTLLRHCEPRC